MAFKSRNIEELKDDQEYRIGNMMFSGKTIKYFMVRGRLNGQGYEKYASYLCENLVQEYAEKNPNPEIPNDLVNKNWQNQAEVTEQTLKSKS